MPFSPTNRIGLVVAGDVRVVGVLGREVVDDDGAAVDPADHTAAGLQRQLALAVLDGERAFARVDAGDSREGERKCEQAEEYKGLPHHGSSIGTPRVPRVMFT